MFHLLKRFAIPFTFLPVSLYPSLSLPIVMLETDTYVHPACLMVKQAALLPATASNCYTLVSVLHPGEPEEFRPEPFVPYYIASRRAVRVILTSSLYKPS